MGMYDNNFLQDNSASMGVGAAIQGFLKGVNDADDRQMKKQEFDAKMKAMQTQADRDALTQQMEKAKDQRAQEDQNLKIAGSGFKKGPDGSFTEGPLSPQVRAANKLKARGEGYKESGFDENGNPLDYVVDTTSPKYLMAKNGAARNQNASDLGQQRIEISRSRLGTTQDSQAAAAVNKIHHDPAIMQMRQQASNIDKGMELLRGKPSFKVLNEVAQDFSAALSGKGVSSDFKLKELMTPSLQQKFADLKAIASGNPDQPANPEVIKFWMDMGTRLNEAYGRQMGARAQSSLKGLGTAYKHNPNAMEAAQEAAQTYTDGSWRDGGLVEGGLVGQPQGLVGAPQGGGQDPDITKYAQQYGLDYAHAKAIIDKRKAGQ